MLAFLHVIAVSLMLGGSVYKASQTFTLPGALPALPEPHETSYKPPKPARNTRPR